VTTRSTPRPKSALASIAVPPRWRAALRYLQWADNIFKWRLSRAECPNCNGHLFLSLGGSPFMTRCLTCGTNATNLSLIPVIKSHAAHSNVYMVWEMSTYGAVLAFLKRTFHHVASSEFFSEVPSGEIVNGTLSQDVQNLSFRDESLDLITSNQVFEHVPDDIRGYSECFRVLKKGGALIFTVPLYDYATTQQLAAIGLDGIKFFGEPEYHDSRTDGPESALTFWRHSYHDICERVSKVGFSARLVDVTIAKSQQVPMKVIYATKA
jgi:SAM-dependent methyltransferase